MLLAHCATGVHSPPPTYRYASCLCRACRPANLGALPSVVRCGNATSARVGARSFRECRSLGCASASTLAASTTWSRSCGSPQRSRDAGTARERKRLSRRPVGSGEASGRSAGKRLPLQQSRQLAVGRSRMATPPPRTCNTAVRTGGCSGCAVRWRLRRARRECRAPWIWLRRVRGRALPRATVQLRPSGLRSSCWRHELPRVPGVAIWP